MLADITSVLLMTLAAAAMIAVFAGPQLRAWWRQEGGQAVRRGGTVSRAARAELKGLERDLTVAAERAVTELDARLQRMEAVVAQAEGLAATLTGALARGNAAQTAQADPLPVPIANSFLHAAQKSAARPDVLASRPTPNVPAPRTTAITKPTSDAAAPATPVPPADPAARANRGVVTAPAARVALTTIPHAELAREVLTLAGAGRSPIQIAQALRRPLGEIELILQLHNLT
jgi:hypothetical protein